MCSPPRQPRSLPCLLGGVLLLALAAPLDASTVLFRNECPAPVIVQATRVYRGMLRRDQYLLRFGEMTPRLLLESDQVITISDGRTGRLLFRDALKASKTPLQYSIVPDRMTGRIRLLLRRVAP